MKFTVREYSNKDITVDFEDGSYAVVPAPNRPLTRAELCEHILDFNPQVLSWDGPIPFEVGEVISFETETRSPGEDTTVFDYKHFRKTLYPKVHDQMDAAYWARKGDTAQQEEIDKAIEEVKALIPKTFPPMTRAQFAQYLLDEKS